MADDVNEADAMARQAWDACQRIAMRVAEEPLETREAALKIAESAVAETATNRKMPDSIKAKWVPLQISLIRQMVLEIDAGGSARGGHA